MIRQSTIRGERAGRQNLIARQRITTRHDITTLVGVGEAYSYHQQPEHTRSILILTTMAKLLLEPLSLLTHPASPKANTAEQLILSPASAMVFPPPCARRLKMQKSSFHG